MPTFEELMRQSILDRNEEMFVDPDVRRSEALAKMARPFLEGMNLGGPAESEVLDAPVPDYQTNRGHIPSNRPIDREPLPARKRQPDELKSWDYILPEINPQTSGTGRGAAQQRRIEANKVRQAEEEEVARQQPDRPTTPVAPATTDDENAGAGAVVPPDPLRTGQSEPQRDYYSDAQEFIKKFYPGVFEPSFVNPDQQKADAFAEKEMQRTKLLAQLALASGITAGGGGMWRDVGRGFGNAAAVYGAGFARYQNALQQSADRYYVQAQQDFRNRQAKGNALFDIYSGLQATDIAKQKQTLAERKAQMEDVKDYVDSMDKLMGDTVLTPEERKGILERLDEMWKRRRVFSPIDVRGE